MKVVEFARNQMVCALKNFAVQTAKRRSSRVVRDVAPLFVRKERYAAMPVVAYAPIQDISVPKRHAFLDIFLVSPRFV